MAENSSIEWTDHTFNPWLGCAKVSAGCLHCYAETLMDTRYGRVEWGVNGTRVRTSEANWRKPSQWNRQAEKEGRRYRVFCSSLADVFEDRPELAPWRRDLLALIASTPHLDWLLLTKRPENVSRMIGEAIGRIDHADQTHSARVWLMRHPNVWIGTSVEDQDAADTRIPHLLRIPAAVRFLSMEPLLGPVDLNRHFWSRYDPGTCQDDRLPALIDWVIVGGESGKGARPMQEEWVRDIKRQCDDAGVPFLFKQWGGVNKKATGRILDGREWSAWPETLALTTT
jgi:protein gp37